MEETMGKYTLGLDIGKASIGWAAIDQENAKLIDMGVRLFKEATPAAQPRLKRSARRTLRRKKWRKQQLLAAFNDFGIIDSTALNQPGYLSYTTDNETVRRPADDTVYHLRHRAIHEKVSLREVLLCLYNICKTRGHFLLETVDFTKEGINYDLFRDRFFDLLANVEFTDQRSFEDMVLKKVFDGSIRSNEIKNTISKNRFVKEEQDGILIAASQIVRGYKGNVSLIDPDFQEGNFNPLDLKKKDDLGDVGNALVELYDMTKIAQIISEGNEYICDVAIQKMEKYHKAIYEDGKEELNELKNSNSKDRLRAVKNLDNNFPNGLYVKEATAILRKQQEYYPQITDQFIEVCSSIISTRIPYFIGPLDSNAKNSWITKDQKFKYSYEYSKNELGAVNEYESILNWKKRMISHCTYLPEEEALPKGSFLAETFSILNEMNLYKCEDSCGGDYYLTRNDKIRIFNELFLKKKSVDLKEVRDLLNLGDYHSKNGNTRRFNNKYTLYFEISSLLPELKIDDIREIFTNKEKIEHLEKMILDINLFDEEKSKIDYFTDERYGYHLKETTARKIAKLKTKSFYSFSKEFILDQEMNRSGESLLDCLFDDNVKDHTNEQMTIISNAEDRNGNKLDFSANKYIKKLKNNNDLSIELLLDDEKPVIPVSRTVIRALNECLKMYKAVISIYGVPARVVIETARGKDDSIKDFVQDNGSPMKHFDKVEKLYDYLIDQLKEYKNDSLLFDSQIEDYEEIKKYYEKNKTAIELYIRQNGIDLLTGKPIDLSRLHDYQIDHIVPRGFGDDSMDDKMLIARNSNQLKKDRVPLEFLEAQNGNGFLSVSRYIQIVNRLYEMRLISENKKERLLLEDQHDLEGFINRNLVDTRYIIREFMSILNAYNQVNEISTHIVAMKAAFTTVYRDAFGIRKNRDFGDQHHALDASVVAMADHILSFYYPNYDQRGDFKRYQEFLNAIENNQEQSSAGNEQEIRSFILRSYFQAYGQDANRYPDSLLHQVKKTKPLVSYKVEKNWKGAFYEETILEKGKDKDSSPLRIIGVNTDKHSFSGVNCVAVDFYKVTLPNGKKKHIGIHIPKIIVSESGVINKEKYLKLVKDFYKADELLDENGELKKYYFRFRAFRNDLIYDTNSNTVQIFNIGSIANKKIELKHLNTFSYDDIYELGKHFVMELNKQFNLKTASNKKGLRFEELSIIECADFLAKEVYCLKDYEAYRNAILKNVEKERNKYNFCNHLAYVLLCADRKNIAPTIFGQYMPTANNNDISKNKDAYYIKLKYHLLGLCFENADGKLVIKGPEGKKEGFSKIRKEEFSWKISKYSV